jgi:peptidase M30-like protein
VTTMKTLFKPFIYGALVCVLTLAGCDLEKGDSSSCVPNEVSGHGPYFFVSKSVGSCVDYTHDLGSTPKDVFFIFTNANSSNVSGSSITASTMPITELLTTDKISTIPYRQETIAIENHKVGVKGKPEAGALGARPPIRSSEVGSNFRSQLIIPIQIFSNIGDSQSFAADSNTTVSATQRQKVVDTSVTLNIWVANDSWAPCSKQYCLTQAMVDAFADKFLKAGTGNDDIYDWVTEVYGLPWGSHNLDSLIPASSSADIDILFFDIDNDGNPGNSPSQVVMGYYDPSNNYLSSSAPYGYTNQRLLFYIDSVLSAEADGTWEISDTWPANLVSTLAHEFQHMIHFYQKNVIHDIGSEIWINEMSSLMAEDFLADKLLADGPRGVAYSDYTAGSSGITDGRLPMFNYYNDVSPTVFSYSTTENYAVNYAFGAYLSRNYGGAELFQKVVQNSWTNYQAITNAVTSMGYDETFTTLLQKWGVAVLLSDQTGLDPGYRYNTGAGFTSNPDSITYTVGSINLYNYSYYGLAGPLLYKPSNVGGHNKLSNTYVKVGTAQTGTFKATVEMASGVRLTVVTKDSN